MTHVEWQLVHSSFGQTLWPGHSRKLPLATQRRPIRVDFPTKNITSGLPQFDRYDP
jgi:hypothetical protein